MTDEAPVDDKTPRFRSPPYPSVPLAKAIERAGALYSKALHHSVPIAVVAQAWNYGGKSSGLFGTIAALIHFGLLTDTGSGDKRRFQLTDSAIRIIRDPDPNSGKRQAALRAAALNPSIHSELWEKYGAAGVSGMVDVALKSYLTLDRTDDGGSPFSDSAANELIQQYRATMTFAGLVSGNSVSPNEVAVEDNGNLSDTGEQSPMPAGSAATTPQNPAQYVPGVVIRTPGELNDIKAEISGGTIRINALLDKAGLEDLEKKIAAYKTLLQ